MLPSTFCIDCLARLFFFKLLGRSSQNLHRAHTDEAQKNKLGFFLRHSSIIPRTSVPYKIESVPGSPHESLSSP